MLIEMLFKISQISKIGIICSKNPPAAVSSRRAARVHLEIHVRVIRRLLSSPITLAVAAMSGVIRGIMTQTAVKVPLLKNKVLRLKLPLPVLLQLKSLQRKHH